MKYNSRTYLTWLVLDVVVVAMVGATAYGHEKLQHISTVDKAKAVSPEALAKINDLRVVSETYLQE